MTCFLQLEDGAGFLQLEDGTGNLLLEFCNDQPQASNWYPLRHKDPSHEVDRRNKEYRASLKQEEIIALKLDAQALIVERAELEKQETKQALRQMAALKDQEAKLLMMIAEEMASLAALQHEVAAETLQAHQRILAQQNLEALVVLQLAYPYLNIISGGGHMH